MGIARQFRTAELMPPKLDDGSETVRMQLVLPKSLVKVVDEWRRVQPDNPNRSEAVRRMIQLGAEPLPRRPPPSS